MDVRKLDPRNWLTIDENYLSEHRVRDVLLRAEKSSVLQCLPESGDACEEVLEEVVGFLCGRVPGLFARVGRDGRDGKEVVVNRVTGERFRIGDGKQDGEQSEMGALEVAVRLAMEDLSILMLNEEGEYYLFVSPPSAWSGLVWSIDS